MRSTNVGDNLLEQPLTRVLTAVNKIKNELIKKHPEQILLLEKCSVTLVVAFALQYRKRQELDGRNSFIIEKVPKTKIPILKKKWLHSNEDTVYLQILQILAIELEREEQKIKPFWDQSCVDKSKQLALLSKEVYCSPTNTYVDYWNKVKKTKIPIERNIAQHFKVNEKECKLANTWNKEEREVTKSHKIKLLPNRKQKQILKEWFGTCRYVYNRALNYINTSNEPYNRELVKKLSTKFITLDSYYRHCSHCNELQPARLPQFVCTSCSTPSISPELKKIRNTDLTEWELRVPKDIRARTLSDLTNSYKTCFSQLSSNTISKFKHSFRRKKDVKSMAIGKENIRVEVKEHTVELFKKFLTPILCSKRSDLTEISDGVPSDSRIVFDGLNYWLRYTTKVVINKDKENTSNPKIVSLDPGARKFMSFFSERKCGMFHRNSDLMRKLWSKIDLLKSLREKGKILLRQSRQKILKINNKIKNIVSDLHWKTANFLCSQFTDILLPDFATKTKNVNGNSMMSNLHRTTNRALDCLSHYQFKCRLLHVASQYENCNVWIVGEAYTSKTCTRCGFVNKKSGNEILRCAGCSYTCDRDYIGSRNIFLKNTVLL